MSRASSPTKSSGTGPSANAQAQAIAEEDKIPISYANFDHLKIAVRERPLGDGEAANVQVVLRTDQEKLIAFYPSSKEGLVYNYDHFYPAESTQSDLFHTIGDEMVSLAINGFSTTFMAVGPSSAGKTHTLFGSDQEAGLIQHVTREVFNQIQVTSDQIEWNVVAQYFEVNGDEICDALSDACTPTAAVAIGVTAAESFARSVAGGGQPQLMEEMVRLRKDNTFGGYSVGGIQEVQLNSWDELDMLLLQGNNRRIHLAEKRRARWHGFVRLYIERTPKLSPSTVTRCVVTFVHTKGPERVGAQGTRGEQMKQGSRLNKSLSLLGSAVLHCADFRRKALKDAIAAGKNINDPAVLGDVIEKSQSFFMESKFTMLIGNSMCGRCATFMLGCVSTTNYHDCTDTLETLQNAQQLTASVATRVTITKFGKLQRQLDKAEKECSETVAAKLAPGHPLTEIEEKVEKLRQRLGNQQLEEEEAPRRAPPPPVNVPQHLQKWKQDTLRAKMHGPHATVYIPTKRAETEYDTYKGDWARGFKDGHGEHITAKFKYVGEWGQGLRDGEGTLWIRDNQQPESEWRRVYKGAWKQGLRHGYGMQWCDNGEVYEGYFECDARSHVGKLFLPNGDRIEGQFANKHVHGWATLYCKNNDWFEGRWFEGMREGPGIWHYVTKEQVYHGSWHKNIPKCGTMMDTEKKSTNANSTFLPTCTLGDPDKVLAVMRAQLEQIRMEEFGVGDFEAAPRGPSSNAPQRPSSGSNSETIGW